MFRILAGVILIIVLGLSFTANDLRQESRLPSSNKASVDRPENSDKANILVDQGVGLPNSDDSSNGGTLLSKRTVYVNSSLGFQISLPPGWYIPNQFDDDPHFYDCATYDCPQGFEIENADDLLSDGPAGLAKRLEDDGSLPVYLNNLVVNAVVLRSSGAAPGWPVHYDVFFKDRAYVISSSSETLEDLILSTFIAIPR
jgi:hypothetical protein